ncbi:MAG: hypothetical protein ACKOWG_01565 [Planctomycetia bacterium]
MAGAEADDLYAFDITLHGRGPQVTDARPPSLHADAWGTWPTLSVPREQLAVPMAIGFDEALERLARLERMYVEPDGSFVWASPREGRWWQVDGNAFEKDGRVLLADLKGSCPRAAFDRLLGAFGWPDQPLLMQLVRAAVFLDETTFRRHAQARWIAGDGATLRPR